MKLRIWIESQTDGVIREATYITDSIPRCLQQAERDLDLVGACESGPARMCSEIIEE